MSYVSIATVVDMFQSTFKELTRRQCKLELESVLVLLRHICRHLKRATTTTAGWRKDLFDRGYASRFVCLDCVTRARCVKVDLARER